MFVKSRYIGSTGKIVEFDLQNVLRLGEGDTLRSHTWTRTIGYRSLTDVSRPAREVTMQFAATLEAADNMRRIFDYDMAVLQPGKLEVGGWTQHCLFPESSADTWRPTIVGITATAALLDGVWRKGTTQHFIGLESPQDTETGKGYPHEYPYGYGTRKIPSTVLQPGYLPAPIKLTIFGAASFPVIKIGENSYKYNGYVPSGSYLTIDGLNKTATLVNANGLVTNALPQLELGDGEGSGQYAFEKVLPGQNSLGWNGSFGFDIELIEEESEPPWILS